MVSFIMGAMESTQESDRDYLVWDAKPVQEFDMQYLAQEAVQTDYPGGIQPLRTTVDYASTTYLIFE